MLSVDGRKALELLPFRERVKKIDEFQDMFLVSSREGEGAAMTKQKFRSKHTQVCEQKLMFGSNNYLNLSTHPSVVDSVTRTIKKNGIGSGGSPEFSGYTTDHKCLELKLASLSDHENSLLLPSGFVGNLCWIYSLLSENEVLFCDINSHASVIEGLKLVKARVIKFDPDDSIVFENLIRNELKRGISSKNIIVTFVGVRSINGSIVDMNSMVTICKKFGLFTVLDDAHGLGVLGERGYGTIEHFGFSGGVDLRMSTCSKAIGAQGAFIAGSSSIINYLRKTSTPYIFTTSLSHASVSAISTAIDLLNEEPDILNRLKSNIRYLTDSLLENGYTTIDNSSGIVPLFLQNVDVSRLCLELYNKGLFVNVIEYPIISRRKKPYIRFSVMSNHTKDDIDTALGIVRSTLSKY